MDQKIDVKEAFSSEELARLAKALRREAGDYAAIGALHEAWGLIQGAKEIEGLLRSRLRKMIH